MPDLTDRTLALWMGRRYLEREGTEAKNGGDVSGKNY